MLRPESFFLFHTELQSTKNVTSTQRWEFTKMRKGSHQEATYQRFITTPNGETMWTVARHKANICTKALAQKASSSNAFMASLLVQTSLDPHTKHAVRGVSDTFFGQVLPNKNIYNWSWHLENFIISFAFFSISIDSFFRSQDDTSECERSISLFSFHRCTIRLISKLDLSFETHSCLIKRKFSQRPAGRRTSADDVCASVETVWLFSLKEQFLQWNTPSLLDWLMVDCHPSATMSSQKITFQMLISVSHAQIIERWLQSHFIPQRIKIVRKVVHNLRSPLVSKTFLAGSCKETVVWFHPRCGKSLRNRGLNRPLLQSRDCLSCLLHPNTCLADVPQFISSPGDRAVPPQKCAGGGAWCSGLGHPPPSLLLVGSSQARDTWRLIYQRVLGWWRPHSDSVQGQLDLPCIDSKSASHILIKTRPRDVDIQPAGSRSSDDQIQNQESTHAFRFSNSQRKGRRTPEKNTFLPDFFGSTWLKSAPNRRRHNTSFFCNILQVTVSHFAEKSTKYSPTNFSAAKPPGCWPL